MTIRAYVMAALLSLIALLAISPHAHAAGRHHHHWHHHHARHAHHRYAGLARHRRAHLAFYPQRSFAEPVIGAASDVLREAEHFVGYGNPTGFRGPWCMAFASMILSKTGHEHVRSLRAIDALRDGYRVRSPEPGDIAVLAMGRHDHVTFFASYGGRGFVGLGGNQGHRVKFSTYSLRRVIAWIRPLPAREWSANYHPFERSHHH